jgi:hypothetical protein
LCSSLDIDPGFGGFGIDALPRVVVPTARDFDSNDFY